MMRSKTKFLLNLSITLILLSGQGLFAQQAATAAKDVKGIKERLQLKLDPGDSNEKGKGYEADPQTGYGRLVIHRRRR